MNLRTCSALLLLVSACATTEPSPKAPVARSPRLANLQRAAALPWRDEGRCVVQEASHPWPVVAERCFHALDRRKIRFEDTQHRCPVASTDAATVETLVGICLLSQPELAVGVVIVISVVVVAVAIHEELEEYTRRRHAQPEEESSGEAEPTEAQTRSSPEEPLTNGRPQPEGLGRDWFPPEPPDSLDPRQRRPECIPRRVPPKGGHPFHNACADNVPLNDFRGANALVNGKAFDALPLATRTLWEVKTDNFDTYPPELKRIVLNTQVLDFDEERKLARACGFNFRIGVRSAAHKAALLNRDDTLDIVIMDWC